MRCVIIAFALGLLAVTTAHGAGTLSMDLLSRDPAHGAGLMTERLKALLDLRYRTEFHMRTFEKNVHQAAENSGVTTSFDIMQDPSYRQLLALRAQTKEATREIVEAYSALHQSIRTQGNEAVGRGSQSMLDSTHRWINSLPEEDQLMLLDLTRQFEDVRRSTQAISGKAPALRPLTEFSLLPPADVEQSFQRLRPKIESKAARVSEQLPAADSTPAPPPLVLPLQERKEPSIDHNGNLFGSEFKRGTFVLTFDDGPCPVLTMQVLGMLAAHRDKLNTRGVAATFFRLVDHSILYPDVIRSTVDANQRMENHSWSHARFDRLDSAALQHEVTDANKALGNAFGYAPRFFRCPYGICIAPPLVEARRLIAQSNLIHAYWSIDSADWENPGAPRRIANIVTDQMTAVGRGVVLMHDIHPQSTQALALILAWIKAQNDDPASKLKIRLVDLGQAVDEYNKDLGTQ